MKKKVLFAWLMLLMAMMACLVACGGDSTSETIAPQTTAAVPETTVTPEIPEEPEVVVTAPLAFFSTGSQGSSHQDGHVFS